MQARREGGQSPGALNTAAFGTDLLNWTWEQGINGDEVDYVVKYFMRLRK